MAQLTVVDDETALATTAAGHLTALIDGAVATHGNVCLCLTGGSTPRRLYSLLADDTQPWRRRITWPVVHLFWSDERHVAPDHADSNFGMAFESLIRHVPVPATQVHRMRGDLADPHEAAVAYDAEIRDAFAAAGRDNDTFDVTLLGIGEDAHIASIFPGSALLDDVDGIHTQTVGRGFTPRHDEHARVAAVWASHLNAWRITLTPVAILDTRAIVVLAAGENKGDAVHAALEEADDLRRWPAQLLRAAGDRVEWILDRATARSLRAP